ncbi:MAG: DMT family transporter [Pseudomonadota bacterium]
MQTPKTMNGLEWGLLLLLSGLWGLAFFFAGVAVREVPPLTIVLARVGLGALCLLPVFWWYGYRLPRSLGDWRPFFVMGLLNNVLPFGFLIAGQIFVTGGLASIVNAMTPLFTILVMAGFREEALTAQRVTGVMLGVVGVAILRGFTDPLSGPQTLGIGLCLLGTLSYGFAALWGRRHLSGVPPLKSATCQLLSSTLIAAVIVAMIDQPWTLPMPGMPVWFALGGLAVLGTALAYIVFFEVLVRAGASNVMLVTLLVPISAVALGAVFLEEPIRAQEIIGALVIFSGLLFIDGRVVTWLRRA